MSNNERFNTEHIVNYSTIDSFKDLFKTMEADSTEAKEAYEYTAEYAKTLVENKDLTKPDINIFEEDIKTKFPNLPDDLIQTLFRCLQNYNPPINVPRNALWDTE